MIKVFYLITSWTTCFDDKPLRYAIFLWHRNDTFMYAQACWTMRNGGWSFKYIQILILSPFIYSQILIPGFWVVLLKVQLVLQLQLYMRQICWPFCSVCWSMQEKHKIQWFSGMCKGGVQTCRCSSLYAHPPKGVWCGMLLHHNAASFLFTCKWKFTCRDGFLR